MPRLIVKCPKCGKNKLWKLADGRLMCVFCRSRFSLKNPSPKIDRRTLKKIIQEFVLEHSTNTIIARVNISKYKLLKILTLLRMVITKDVSEVFDGIVEVDETYLGGQWKNKPLKIKLKSRKPKRGRGTTKQPVFGILCRSGRVWAELISGIETNDLQPLIEKQVRKGSVVCSDEWRAYTGIAAKGYVHRLIKHSQNRYSDRKGNHINGLEGFWGYLKRKLKAKGGIRRKRLHLFLGEYAWRYNHRNLSFKERENLLFKRINQHFRSE